MLNLDKDDVVAVFKSRASTRSYDADRKISDDEFLAILECARLSPSSVGSEPWRLLVIQNPTLRQKLKPVSWGMANTVESASHKVPVILW